MSAQNAETGTGPVQSQTVASPGQECPADPTIMVAQIKAMKYRNLGIWFVVASIACTGILFVCYKIIGIISDWNAMRTKRKIVLKGRNNVFDASDDNYTDRSSSKSYTAPSGRTIKYNLQRSTVIDKTILDSRTDNYKSEDEEKTA